MEELRTDFSEEVAEAQTEETILFQGKNAKGETVMVQYFQNDKTMYVYASRGTE